MKLIVEPEVKFLYFIERIKSALEFQIRLCRAYTVDTKPNTKKFLVITFILCFHSVFNFNSYRVPKCKLRVETKLDKN